MINLEELPLKLQVLFDSILSKNKKELSDLGEAHHLSEFFPYKWYDEDSECYIADGGVGLIFEVFPLVVNSEAMQKELSNIFTSILPEESSVQVMLYADKNIGKKLQDYVNSRVSSSKTLQALAKRRAEHLGTLAIKSELYIYVLRDFKGYLSINIKLKNNIEESIEETVNIKKQIDATLNIFGITHSILEPHGLLRLLDGIFNTDF